MLDLRKQRMTKVALATRQADRALFVFLVLMTAFAMLVEAFSEPW